MTYPIALTNPAQAQWPVVVNENAEALAHVAVYSNNYQTTTSATTWGYHGGRWGGYAVADGTLTLTNAADNYIVVLRSSGAISVSTTNTNWSNTTNYARVYKITLSGGAVTATEDHRAGLYGVHGIAVAPSAVGDVVGPASATDNDLARFDGTTGKLIKAGFSYDTDATLAANSNTRVPTQAAVKAYADALVAGLSWKQAVRVATTAAGTLASDFENGDTVDGVTLATGNRILIKNQAAGAENGIYVVAASGAPTRATDANSSAELVNATCYVSEGSANADTQWTCSTNATIVVDTTALTFAQLTSGGGSVATDTIWDAKGDLAVGTGANTASKLTVGTDGYVLKADSAEATGLKWVAESAGSGTKTYAVFTPMTSQPPASNFATLDTRNSIAVLDFDDTTEESAFWVAVIPEGASLGSGLIVNIFFMATSATSGDCRFGVQFERMNTDEDSDSFDTATEATAATSGTSGIITKLQITATAIDSIAAGDPYRIKIYRDTTGADTITGDVEVVAVEVRSAA